jgi:hypothetical protein
MSAREGPPNEVGPRDTTPEGTDAVSRHAHQIQATPDYPTTRRQCVDALRRRRVACRRMVPLDCCGCRDPWPCRCTDPPLAECQVDHWRDAALHLLRAGHMPLLPLEARRALWRRGGPDRELAELLHDACGGEAA